MVPTSPCLENASDTLGCLLLLLVRIEYKSPSSRELNSRFRVAQKMAVLAAAPPRWDKPPRVVCESGVIDIDSGEFVGGFLEKMRARNYLMKLPG